MATDVKKLFKIVGEEGPALRRVEEAMEWLLSPKAEGIGEQLLHDAHALHGKPITIAVSKEAGSGYLNAIGEHTIRLNPHHVEKISILAADGSSHAMSVERCLGHELKHAGQPRMEEGVVEKMLLETHIGAARQSTLTPEQQANEFAHLFKALDAPDYHTAMAHLEHHVDKAVIPMQLAVDKELFAHPDYIKHVEEFEMPAIRVENQIATLRGEPTRTDYTSSHQITPENRRQMMIDELSAVMELNTKPRLSINTGHTNNNTQSWVSYLNNRTAKAPTISSNSKLL
jgi:hypothetical protein